MTSLQSAVLGVWAERSQSSFTVGVVNLERIAGYKYPLFVVGEEDEVVAYAPKQTDKWVERSVVRPSLSAEQMS